VLRSGAIEETARCSDISSEIALTARAQATTGDPGKKACVQNVESPGNADLLAVRVAGVLPVSAELAKPLHHQIKSVLKK